MRYCTEDAYFCIQEINLGLVADIGTLQRLPKIINPGIMAELAYTGRKVFGKRKNNSIAVPFPSLSESLGVLCQCTLSLV